MWREDTQSWVADMCHRLSSSLEKGTRKPQAAISSNDEQEVEEVCL